MECVFNTLSIIADGFNHPAKNRSFVHRSIRECMEKFGEKLRSLRTRRGLTLRELSNLLDVSYGYIGQMERGERKPNVAMLVKVADLFEVSLDKLVRDELELD